MEGDGLANTFWGDNGDDLLSGLFGNDSLAGGGGNDKLLGGEGRDYLNGGEGFDTSCYWDATSAVQVYLDGSKANSGGATGDVLVDIEGLDGGSFNDILVGNANANTLWGGAGMDRMAGGAGADTLGGGDGCDAFVFDKALGASNVDVIVDFDATDEAIVLSRSVFTNIREHELGINYSNFTLGSAATSTSHRLIYNNFTGDLFYDRDGVGGAAQIKFAFIGVHRGLTWENFKMESL